jgi:hypothetical protein
MARKQIVGGFTDTWCHMNTGMVPLPSCEHIEALIEFLDGSKHAWMDAWVHIHACIAMKAF